MSSAFSYEDKAYTKYMDFVRFIGKHMTTVKQTNGVICYYLDSRPEVLFESVDILFEIWEIYWYNQPLYTAENPIFAIPKLMYRDLQPRHQEKIIDDIWQYGLHHVFIDGCEIPNDNFKICIHNLLMCDKNFIFPKVLMNKECAQILAAASAYYTI
jgi:hypothetical protein